MDAHEIIREWIPPRLGKPSEALVLTQLHNAFFVYGYEGEGRTAKRRWKSPALKMDHEVPEVCVPDKGTYSASPSVQYLDHEGILLITYRAELSPRTGNEPSQRMIVVKRTGDGLRSFGVAEKSGAIEVRSTSPLTPAETAWVQRNLNPPSKSVFDFPCLSKGKPAVAFKVMPESDGNAALAHIHAKALAIRGARKPEELVRSMEQLLLWVDVRTVGQDAEGLTRLNDLAYWLGESGRPWAALFLLDVVLGRDSERAVAHLNRGDVYFGLAEAQRNPSWHLRACEDYRHYVRALLAQGKKVPAATAARLSTRLGETELNAQTCRSRFLLSEAIQAGDLEQFRLLLNQGLVGPDERNGNNQAPLMQALEAGRLDMVQLLLDKGANPEAVGEAPFLIGALRKAYYRPKDAPLDLGLVERVLRMGADPDPVDRSNTSHPTALMTALDFDQADEPMIRLLIEKSTRINHQNREGNSPLHLVASQFDKPNARLYADLLLARGANPNLSNQAGYSPLHRVMLALAYESETQHTRRQASEPPPQTLDSALDLALPHRLMAQGASWRAGLPAALEPRRRWMSRFFGKMVESGSEALLALALQGLTPAPEELDTHPAEALARLHEKVQEQIWDPKLLPELRQAQARRLQEWGAMEKRLRAGAFPFPTTSRARNPSSLTYKATCPQPEGIQARMTSAAADEAYAKSLPNKRYSDHPYRHPFYDAVCHGMALETQGQPDQSARLYLQVIEQTPKDGYPALREKEKAKARLARLHALGLGVPKDVHRALELMGERTQFDHEEQPWTWVASTRMAKAASLEAGTAPTGKNIPAALAIYHQFLADRDDPCLMEQASFRIGEILWKGDGIPRDIPGALKALKHAGVAGALRVAELRLQGWGGQAPDPKAAQEALVAGFSGCGGEANEPFRAKAHHLLGRLLRDGLGSERQLGKALHHLESAGPLGAQDLDLALKAIPFILTKDPGAAPNPKGQTAPPTSPTPPRWADACLIATQVFGQLPAPGTAGTPPTPGRHFNGTLSSMDATQGSDWLLIGASTESAPDSEGATQHLAVLRLAESPAGKPLVQIIATSEGIAHVGEQPTLPREAEWPQDNRTPAFLLEGAHWLPLRKNLRLLAVPRHLMEGYGSGGGSFESLMLFSVEAGYVGLVAHLPTSISLNLAGDWNKDGTRNRDISEHSWRLQVLTTTRDGWPSLKLVPTTKGSGGLTLHWNPNEFRYQP